MNNNKSQDVRRKVKNALLYGCLLGIALLATISTSTASGGNGGGNTSGGSGDVLVRLKPGASIQTLANDYHVNILDRVPDSALYSLSVPGKTTASTFAKQLTGDARVVYAEVDTPVVAPEVFQGNPIHFSVDRTSAPAGYVNQLAYGQAAGNVSLAGFDPNAPASLTGNVTGSGVVVAVLDSGICFSHPALAGHLAPGYNALQPDTAPWDVPDGVTNDEVGHGTMVAGIIARLAPDATILPVRVLNADGIGSMLDIAKGVHFAVTHQAKVINMSFGAPALTNVMKDALDEAEAAGVVLVAAAGNDGLKTVQYPAAGRSAIAVGSVESDNTKSWYSNYGPFVQVVAPGTGIRSTYWDGGYATWSGTSFATPFVSAEAALILSVNPAADVKHVIRATAHPVDAVNRTYRGLLGDGLIDLAAGVNGAWAN